MAAGKVTMMINSSALNGTIANAKLTVSSGVARITGTVVLLLHISTIIYFLRINISVCLIFDVNLMSCYLIFLSFAFHT